jgi:hypothetical protein
MIVTKTGPAMLGPNSGAKPVKSSGPAEVVEAALLFLNDAVAVAEVLAVVVGVVILVSRVK